MGGTSYCNKKNKEWRIWKDTEQTGRGQTQKRIACHINELTGKSQKILNSIVRVYDLCFVKITLKITHRSLEIKQTWISISVVIFAYYFVSGISNLFDALFIFPSIHTIMSKL